MNVKDYLHSISDQKTKTHNADDSETERKRPPPNENSEQHKNNDLLMHMYKVLSSRSKNIDESKRQNTARVRTICERIMSNAMEHEAMFQKFFSDELNKTDVEIKLELVDVNRYDLRVYMKDLPLPDSVQVGFGASAGVPHGFAKASINDSFGRVEKMILKSAYGDLLSGNVLSPQKIIPWFTDGIVRAVRTLQMDDADPDHNKINVKYCETGVQLEVQETSEKNKSGRRMSTLTEEGSTSRQKPSQIILVTFIASFRATGIPKCMRLHHPLPNREPYASRGKARIDELTDEANEGQSLYTLDACLELDDDNKPIGGYWNTNLSQLTDQVLECARTFGKINMIDPAIHVIEMISISRNWDIPSNIIETAALWEYKKSAHKLRNEAHCFSSVLKRLHSYFESHSCPHFLLANYNLLKLAGQEWCEVIGKQLSDAVIMLDDEPSSLLDLTGARKRKKRTDDQKNTDNDDAETASVASHSVANESIA